MNITDIIGQIYEGENTYNRIRMSSEIYSQAEREVAAIIQNRIRTG
jgi:hypothetical protein